MRRREEIAALVELSGLVDPKQAVQIPSRKAIVETTRQLRRKLQGSRWPLPYQVVGLSYCELAHDRVIIADEQGLGKTGIALVRALLTNSFPLLVVAPASVLINWKKEAGLWLPNIPVHRLDKSGKPVPPPKWPGIVVTTWDLLFYHSVRLAQMRPAMVVADECHYALNPQSRRAEHFERVITSTDRLLLLSGTPIVNRARDLWRLLHLLDNRAWPEAVLPSFKEMDRESFDAGVQSRLSNRVRQYLMRRLKADALPDLAPKRERVLPVHPSEDQLAKYRRVEDHFLEWLRQRIEHQVEEDGLEGDEASAEVEERLDRAIRSPALVQATHLRHMVGRLKVPAAVEWISAAVSAGEPVVAFATHDDVLQGVLHGLLRRKIRAHLLVGRTTKTRRASLVEEFQAGKIDVILGSSAAKEGITLTRAAHVLRIERLWTASGEDQGADRVHRIGQTREVTIWTMMVEGTIDARMDQRVTTKRKVTRRAVDCDGVQEKVAPQ